MAHRLATLAVALTAVLPAAAQEPAKPKGPTTIDAQTIEGVSDVEVTARGAAQVQRDDITVFGEVLRYNRAIGRVEGEGGVRLQQGADRFFGPRLQYNTGDDTGFFEEPGFLLQRDRPARGGADRLEFAGKDRYRLTNAWYTTCVPGRDDWRLEASELELDYGKEEGEAKGVRVRFFDTTIIGAPFATFPLSDRRKSGLLTPYYAQTSQRGAEFGIPYYWNIAPERDLTLTPVYMGRRGFQLKNDLRYLDADYAGELKLEYLPSDQVLGRSRDGTSLQHNHRFSANLTGQIDYNRVSDDSYFVDLASSVRQVTVRNLPQDANLTYNGFLGEAPYVAQARVQRFQTLQDPAAPLTPPYHRLPQVTFNTSHYGLAGLFDSTLPAEYVRFAHPSPGAVDPNTGYRLIESTRVSATPAVTAALVAPGWFVRPKVGMRTVNYAFDDPAPGTPGATSLNIPFASLDSGVILERDSVWFGNRLTQTLEPRLFYVHVPNRSQNHIPIFDTALADFNYSQLFTENRFVGGDRFGDAHQATFAVTSRFLRQDGLEAFRATLGQRYYFADEHVGLTPASPVRRNTESDILASIGGRVFTHWTFDTTAQYNRFAEQTERFNASLRYSPELAKVVNFTYRFDRAAIRQIDLSSQWPVAAGWYAVGRYNYSLLDKQLLEGLAGFEYNAGCWVFRAVVQRIQAFTLVSSTTLLFQLEFNGVGRLGTDEAVELLKRSVPGYSVTNPGDPSLAPPGARPRVPFQQVY